MRLRGIYTLLTVAAGVGAMLVLAGPAAASNLHCGEVLDSSVTLIGNLDCTTTPGDAITIGHDGVTLNLNGFTIKGYPGDDVIENGYNGVTVKNGTLSFAGSGIGFDNGGSGVTLDVVTITGDGTNINSTGVYSSESSGLTVLDGAINGVKNGVYLYEDTGDLIKHNTIKPAYNDSYGCAGVYESYGTDNMIYGNAFSQNDPTGHPQTCYGLRTQYSAGTQFTLNTVTGMLAGVKSRRYSAGLTITQNVMDGNETGIYLEEYDSGDMIAGNFIKNSAEYGVSDWNSFNNTYNGNILTSNGSAGSYASYYIYPDGDGPVTMVNNYARLGYSYGFWVADAYSSTVSGPPYSVFSGNNAIANGTDGNPGFYGEYNVGATWSANNAYANASDGFYFNKPWREIVTGNMAKLNGDDGFMFYDVYENTQPLAVTNNSATYNGGYGFSGWDDEAYIGVTAYPVAGSGNTGGGTNGIADCYLVAGCS